MFLLSSGNSVQGPLTFGKKDELVFLGREISQQRDYSESTAIEIDREVKRIVSEAYDRAEGTITENQAILVSIAESLLERETLNADELLTLRDGGTLPDKDLKSGPEPSESNKVAEEPSRTRATPTIGSQPEEGPASA